MNTDLEKGLKNLRTPESFWPPQNTSTTPASSDPPLTNNINQGQQMPGNQTKKAMDCKVIRHIVKTIDVANGTVAGTYSSTLSFGKEVKRILGYYAIVTSLGGLTIAQIKLGLADKTRTIIDPIQLEHYTVSTAVPIGKRFFTEEPIELNGGDLVVSIVNSATFSSAFQVQIIAKCELA
jgi:hypothetical protein